MNNTDWISTRDKLPEEGELVETLTPEGVTRKLKKGPGRIWFLPDSEVYVYFAPTHWRPIDGE